MPINMAPTAKDQAMLTDRAAAWLLIGGRLKSGVSVRQAGAEMDAIGRMLEREFPDQNRDKGMRVMRSSPSWPPPCSLRLSG